MIREPPRKTLGLHWWDSSLIPLFERFLFLPATPPVFAQFRVWLWLANGPTNVWSLKTPIPLSPSNRKPKELVHSHQSTVSRPQKTLFIPNSKPRSRSVLSTSLLLDVRSLFCMRITALGTFIRLVFSQPSPSGSAQLRHKTSQKMRPSTSY